MQRITITIDDELLAAIDARASRRGYQNRSEAIRDLVREAVARDAEDGGTETPCIATLGYVYDHHRRGLAQRITEDQHDHHDLTVAALHVHLDATACLEVAVLRGPRRAVQSLADGIVSQTGVRHGHLHVVPAAAVEHGEE